MSTSMTERARDLRQSQTVFERKFWARVRNRQLGGLKFKGQFPVEPYIADFFCEEAALIVELDGGQHGEDEGAARDLVRDRFLERESLEVFRLWNRDFLRDPVAALDHVLHVANARIAAGDGPLTRKR